MLKEGKGLRNLVVSFDVDHTFAKNNPFLAYGTETTTPAYTLLHAGISANVIRKNKTLFSFYLNGTNLADVAYQHHLSRLKYAAVNPVTGRQGVFNTGRNFSIKLNIPFSF